MPRRFTAHASADVGLKRKSNDPVYENRTVRQLVEANGLGNKRERETVSAVESKTHLMLAISNENANRVSTDGSTFTLPMEQSNLKIPETAFNVNARLIDVVVPYTWPNFNNPGGEKLLFEFEDERQYQLVEHGGYTAYTSNTDIKSLFSAAGSGNHKVGFDGASAHNADDGVLTTGSNLLTENNYSSYNFYYQEFTASTNISVLVSDDADYVFHLVWEEPTPATPYQANTREIIFRTTTFDVITEVSTTTGLRRLLLDYYYDASNATEFVLSESYQLDKTNVLSILYDYNASGSEKVYVLYNDVLQVNGTTLTVDTDDTRAHGNMTVLASAHTTRRIRIPFVSYIPSVNVVTMGEARTSTSHWYHHGFLVHALKGTFVEQPHVKIIVGGLDSADGTSAGTVISIPVLHDNDNDLTFSTLPTLLGYMQRVLNQYVFREFYFSDFLSVDLIENPVNSSTGADYLIQFDYDLSRSNSVTALTSTYNLEQHMYDTDGHKMNIEMSPAPYYIFVPGTDDATPGEDTTDLDDNLVEINFDGTVYGFDIEDLSAMVSAAHGGATSARGGFSASREDIAHFVYDCIYRVFEANNMYLPASWDQRASQPANSPIVAVHRNSALVGGIDEEGTMQMKWDYRIQFKGKDTFVTNAGGGDEPSAFTIDLRGLGAGERVNQANMATTRVVGVYTDTGTTFTDQGTVAEGTDFYCDIFADIDTLTTTITYESGQYNADHFEQYTNEALNEYFMSSTHGGAGTQNLFRLNRNEFSQEVQLGFMMGRADPVLPNSVVFSFPNQTSTTSNGIAQMLFSGTVLDLEGDNNTNLDLLSMYASGPDSGYEYHPPVADVTSNLLARPTFDLENCQSITIDYSRVHSSLAGVNHLVLPRDERTRIFSVNPFSGESNDTGDLSTFFNQVEITIPTGSYNAETLTREINYQLYAADNELARDIILVEEIIPQQKLRLAAILSSDPNNRYPHKVTIKTLDTSDNAPSKFATLIGWDLESNLVLEAPDHRIMDEVQYSYTSALQNQHTFKTRHILVRASFVSNSTAPDGQSRQILAAFSPNVGPGENIIFNPTVPIVTSVKGYLTGDKAAEFLRFELLDASTNLPLEVGSDNPWSVQFMIEYQVQIKQSQIQTAANAPNQIAGF